MDCLLITGILIKEAKDTDRKIRTSFCIVEFCATILVSNPKPDELWLLLLLCILSPAFKQFGTNQTFRDGYEHDPYHLSISVFKKLFFLSPV